MKRNLFLAIGCACALTFSACGGEEEGGHENNNSGTTGGENNNSGTTGGGQTIQKTVCERIADNGSMGEHECESLLALFKTCRFSFEEIANCMMDQGVSTNPINASFDDMSKYCPADYLQFRSCVSSNATKITVPQYCAAHEDECGYFFTSSCESDYSSQVCAPQYAALMDCALNQTAATCDDYTVVANTSVQEQIAQRCFLEALNLSFCKN